MLGNESAQRDDPIDPNLTRFVEFVRLEFGNFSLACFDDVVGGLYHPAKKQAGVVHVGEIVVASGHGSCSQNVGRKTMRELSVAECEDTTRERFTGSWNWGDLLMVVVIFGENRKRYEGEGRSVVQRILGGELCLMVIVKRTLPEQCEQ